MVTSPDSAIQISRRLGDRSSNHSCSDVREFAAGLLSQKLGNDYRTETLRRWNNGKRVFLPDQYVMSAWRQLTLLIGAGRLCLEADINDE